MTDPYLYMICFTHAVWHRSNSWNSSLPCAPYMRQRIGSASVQIMACCLFGAKPFPYPMLAYFHLDSWKQISVTFESELYHILSRKYIWKCLPNWRHFCTGGDELTANTSDLHKTAAYFNADTTISFCPMPMVMWYICVSYSSMKINCAL